MGLVITAIAGLLLGWATRTLIDEAIARRRRRRYLDGMDSSLATRNELELSWERQGNGGRHVR